ncbi:MAG: phosphodiesterase [Candidatus Promineifilaceae bacterium]
MNAVKLIVIGDPHIGENSAENRGVSTAAHLTQAIEHINQHHSDAALCLFLGDLVHNGDSAEYTHFKAHLEALTVPHALMIGNHDNRANFLNAFPNTRQDRSGFIQFAIDIGDQYRLIALDSLNAPPYSSLRHIGKLCEQRLAFLATSLQEAGDRQIIVAMHHQPFRTGLPGMDAIRLWNGEEYLALLKQHPKVAMLLMGHNHRLISGISHGFPFTCFKSMSMQTPLDFDALDPTGGIAEPPSYGVLLLTENGILVHQAEFTTTAPRQSGWDAVAPETKAGWQTLVNAMLPERAI